MSQYNHLAIWDFHVECNIDYLLCISLASRHLRTTHTTHVALTFPITTLHNDNNIVIDGMPQPPSLVSFFFFSFYFFNLLIYLFIYIRQPRNPTTTTTTTHVYTPLNNWTTNNEHQPLQLHGRPSESHSRPGLRGMLGNKSDDSENRPRWCVWALNMCAFFSPCFLHTDLILLMFLGFIHTWWSEEGLHGVQQRKQGPNNARCVVWAIGIVTIFLILFCLPMSFHYF